jgi:hypothetical protein
MKRIGLRIGGYAVTGDYISTKFERSHDKYLNCANKSEKPSDFKFRNAFIRFRDHHHDFGTRVDIRVPVWHEKDVDGDSVYSDWIIIHAPDISMWDGIILLKGFVSIYMLDGKKLSDIFDAVEAPMKRGEFYLRPESSLDDEGKCLKDLPPKKRRKPQ